MDRTLILMRHGRAASGIGMDDADRPLTAEGLAEVEAAAAGLRALVPVLDAIISSPFLRAEQTAFAVAASYGREHVERCMDLTPDSDPVLTLERMLAIGSDGRTLLAVGHMPSLAKLAYWLLPRDPDAVIGFDPAGAVALRVPGEPGRGSGQLAWQHSAVELIALGPRLQAQVT